ncbi:MAG TPA: hypothetical protein VLA90_05575 [Actinomycetota bacterium]|nr:hypothetical protein [Actinomycetota bacterium]
MDVLGLFVGAWLGTFVMTALMEAAQAARLTRMSIPFLLGAMVSERRFVIRVVGFALHLVNGVLFALAYALFFEAIGRSDWWLGALAGAIHGTLVLILLLPVLQDVHPRMSRVDQGPDPTPMLQPPGFLALNYGSRTPVVTFAGHVVYGAIVGGFYRPLG